MAGSTIDDLDTGATLAAIEEGVRRRRAAEVEDLLLVAHWADLHASDPRLDPRPDPSLPRPPGSDRLEQVGGEGTPRVRELALCELGIARRVHTLAARAVTADVLDLRHRLPDLWALVVALKAEPWLARKVAAMSRHLPAEVVHVVDAAVAEAIRGEAPSRVLRIAEAKVIEADEAAHRERLRAEQERRHVSLTRTDEVGLRCVIARVTAGDAAWVDATVTRVAEILAARPEHAGRSRDLVRSIAFGWLARPAELLALLLEHREPAADGDEPDGPTRPEELAPTRALALPGDLLDALRDGGLAKKLRPPATLYVHLHQAALEGFPGVARVEGLGPHTVDQVRELLRHCRVTVTPVIDLHDRVSVNCYEHPEAIKERVHLIRPEDAFPHASAVTRRVDLDHPVPYDPGGPPGQTSSHTSQPLGRTAHRAKTHLGYRTVPLLTGETAWRTPHGRHRLVDARGTHVIDASEFAALTGDDPVDRALARLVHRHRTGQLSSMP